MCLLKYEEYWLNDLGDANQFLRGLVISKYFAIPPRSKGMYYRMKARQTGRVEPSSGSTCYKLLMSRTTERWLLFKYVGGEFTPLSKPLRTKERAEQARLKYPEKEARRLASA